MIMMMPVVAVGSGAGRDGTTHTDCERQGAYDNFLSESHWPLPPDRLDTSDPKKLLSGFRAFCSGPMNIGLH
jgi:hypothetical protein